MFISPASLRYKNVRLYVAAKVYKLTWIRRILASSLSCLTIFCAVTTLLLLELLLDITTDWPKWGRTEAWGSTACVRARAQHNRWVYRTWPCLHMILFCFILVFVYASFCFLRCSVPRLLFMTVCFNFVA